MVQVDAPANDRERVAREVGVGHRIDQEVGLGLVIVADKVGQEVARLAGELELVLADAGDALLDEGLGVLDGVHELLDGGADMTATEAGLVKPLLGELLAGACGIEGLGDELLEIEDLDALLAQDLRKAVVLLLRDLEEGHVVKEQTAELVRRQVQEFLTGTVKTDLLQGANLAVDIKPVSHGSSHSFRAGIHRHHKRILHCRRPRPSGERGLALRVCSTRITPSRNISNTFFPMTKIPLLLRER